MLLEFLLFQWVHNIQIPIRKKKKGDYKAERNCEKTLNDFDLTEVAIIH